MNASFHAALTLLLGLALCVGVTAETSAEAPTSRFHYSGDGHLHLFNAKSGAVFKGIYRQADGTYNPTALAAIQRVFDAPLDNPLGTISLRLITFLDYLESQLNPGARIEIASGWRSPSYNTQLRTAGRLAASASMHQYGMAADIRIEGVDSRRVWHFVRDLGFGGTGYYHGRLVHVDVGPARFWDSASSGVGTGISDDNKLIGLVTDYDRYRPGDTVVMRFIRMTLFPIDIDPEWILEKHVGGSDPETISVFKPALTDLTDTDGACPRFSDIGEMMNITWVLPANLSSGRYTIRSTFCEGSATPDDIITPAFEVESAR